MPSFLGIDGTTVQPFRWSVNTGLTMQGGLDRPESLGTRPITFDFRQHPGRDGGARTNGAQVLVKATEPARRKFTELVRLFDALAALMDDPKQVAGWLQEPNPAFDGSTPLQVIERGETDRLWRMIHAIESGEPG